MDYAIVAVPAAPVRIKARHQREMVSQLLFGEAVKILREKGPLWVKIRSLHDNYEGWMTRNLLQEVSEMQAAEQLSMVTGGLLNHATVNGHPMVLPVGASLPSFINGQGKIGNTLYQFGGDAVDRTQAVAGSTLLEELTFPWLNAPYLWGGRTLFGVDCSGFVQVNYKMMGIDLPRDAWQQAQEGKPVKKLKDAESGDLAFFDDRDEIVHVGILLGGDRIIHASGKVRIDTIDKKRIVQPDTGKRTHRLKAIRRYW